MDIKQENNDFVQKVLDIINSAERVMPAHFTSNGSRTQSFCVNFDISEVDEYEMASEAWRSNKDPSIIKIGEDIMLAVYIATVLNGERYLPQIYHSIVETGASNTSSESESYFKHCAEFGNQRAVQRKNKQ